MATNFSVKIGEIGLFTCTFIRRPAVAFGNGLQYRYSDFKKIICDDLSILYVNLVNLGNCGNPVTPEFKRVVGVHPLILKKIETNYLRIYLTDFHHIFTVW